MSKQKQFNRYQNFVHRMKDCHKSKQQAIFAISAPSATGKDGL
jgi:hypothetical protein